MEKFILLILIFFCQIGGSSSQDEPSELARLLLEQKIAIRKLTLAPKIEGLTLLGFLDFEGGEFVSKIPRSVKIKNPFVESIEVAMDLNDETLRFGAHQQLFIEVEDSVLGEWRYFMVAVGSSIPPAIKTVAGGEVGEFKLSPRILKHFEHSMEEMDYPSKTKMRFAFRLNGVVLRSSDFLFIKP